MSDKTYQYWLRSVKNLRNKKIKKLVQYCGSAKELYHLTPKQILEVEGISVKDAEAIIESKKMWNLKKELEKLKQNDIRFVTLEEEEYPQQLRYLTDAPYALFYKGELPSEDEKRVAIIGARMCSSYGKSVAIELGEKLSANGIGVVSGMAAGVDSFGHWGALKGNGKTYAVLGCGVDVCYPKGARELYGKIAKAGGILSEYLPGTEPYPSQFPARNRIISALADVVVIVEAKRKSGSLITADFALEQGKEVFAVPGRVDDVLSMGCNELLKQGAGVITSVDEFLNDMGIFPDKKTSDIEKIKKLLEKEEVLVYSCFDLHTKNMEELVQMTNIPAEEMANVLVKLQTKGLIEEFYLNHYRKK